MMNDDNNNAIGSLLRVVFNIENQTYMNHYILTDLKLYEMHAAIELVNIDNLNKIRIIDLEYCSEYNNSIEKYYSLNKMTTWTFTKMTNGSGYYRDSIKYYHNTASMRKSENTDLIDILLEDTACFEENNFEWSNT